jgi:hypothetical protein
VTEQLYDSLADWWLASRRRQGISTPLSTLRWIPLHPVSQYHQRQPDGRRMEMLLEDKNTINGTPSTLPAGCSPAK